MAKRKRATSRDAAESNINNKKSVTLDDDAKPALEDPLNNHEPQIANEEGTSDLNMTSERPEQPANMTTDRTSMDSEKRPSGSSNYVYAMVCANNVNRSTEGHDRLREADMTVESFGAGRRVQLPGPKRNDPRVYEFGTPYKKMYDELKAENEELYRRNGVLSMLERDILTKLAPQRWQDQPRETLARLDVVICFEDRIWDIVVEDLQSRDQEDFKPIHVVCLDIKDTPEDAKGGGSLAVEFCKQVDELDDLESDLPEVIQDFEERHKIKLMYSVQYV